MSVSANPNYGVIVANVEKVTLSGTNGSANTFSDFAISPGTARAEWEFRAHLTDQSGLWREKNTGSDTQFRAGVEWVNVSDPKKDYWIKATQTGVTGAGDAPNVGDSLDTWLRLDGFFRSWGWEVSGPGFEFRYGAVRIDIATDSGGTEIVATGYYGGNVDKEI